MPTMLHSTPASLSSPPPPSPPPPPPPPHRSKFRMRRVHARRSSSHSSSSSSSTAAAAALSSPSTLTISPSTPPSTPPSATSPHPPTSPTTKLTRHLTRTSLTPHHPSSLPTPNPPPQTPSTTSPTSSPRRAAIRASKDAKSCPVLPVPTQHPHTSSPPNDRPVRRGSLPVPKLPPLNFGNLPSPCPVSNDLHTPRRRVEAITTSLSPFRPYLYVCADAPARDLQALTRARVTHVVNLAGKQSANYHSPTLKYLTLYVRDDPAAASVMTHLLDEIAAFIDQARAAGSACVIHCTQGISRSVTAALAYVIMKDGVSLDDAMRDMRLCRPIASPNDGFYELLRQLESYVRHGQSSAQVFVIRRHAPHIGDNNAPFVLQRAQKSRSLDEREVYVLRRPARRGIVVWQGRSCDATWKQNAWKIARRLAEQERIHATRFPDGGPAKGIVLTKPGENDQLQHELLKALREG